MSTTTTGPPRRRPLSGRELSQQHQAMVEAGVSALARLTWLRDEVDLWEVDRMSPTETDPPVPAPVPPTVVSYGGGRCAVCQVKTRTGNLMCTRHWDRVPFALKSTLYDCLRRWKYNACPLEELRQAQTAAIEAVTGTVQVPTLEGGEPAHGPITD
jgi:hypothetical protein